MIRTITFITIVSLSFCLPAVAQYRVESFRGGDVVAGEILVKFRGLSGPQAMSVAAQDADIVSSEPVGGTGVVRLTSRNRNVGTLLQAYGSRIDVIYAEPNYVWHASDFPNDEFFSQQWGMKNTGQTISGTVGTSGADIGAVQAWDITEGSRSIVIGVVDTGIDYNHPDLAPNIWSAPSAFTVTIAGKAINCAAGTHGFNAIARTCDPADDVGHGTHVSGILGASGNNGSGVTGVSRVASIMGLKFLGAQGGTTTDALAALDFAVQVKSIFPVTANIRVLNNSWGGGIFSQALLDEVNLVNTNDMLFVVASGNTSLGSNNDLLPDYPANFTTPNVVSVAATDNRDGLASFSNWGPTSVDLGAPGDNIFSTLPQGLLGYASGTSLAAPMVSGAAALLLSACPLTTAALKTALLNTVDAVPSLAGKTVTGGRLNVLRALTNCTGGGSAAFGLTVSPGKVQIDPNQTATFSVTVTGANGFTAPVTLALQGLPAGMSGTLSTSSISGGSGSSTLALTVGPTVEAGTYTIGVTGTSGSIQRVSSASVTVGFAISSGQTISGQLSTTDSPSTATAGRYADLYRLTLSATTAVTIDLNSRVFDTLLFLRSKSGQVLSEDDDSGFDNNSRIQTTLAPGTYSIEVTSRPDAAVGRYTLSINTPTLAGISPNFGAAGSTVNVTLTGDRFASPMTIAAGSGIAVSSLSVVSPSTATAVFTIEPGAARTLRELTVQTPEGVSNPLPFDIPPVINVGQRISAELSSGDQTLVNAGARTYLYADIYQFTVLENAPITIETTSSSFNLFVRVLSKSGAVLFQTSILDPSAPGRIEASFTADTYFIEVRSRSAVTTGAYELAVNLPALNSIIPGFLGLGATTTVAIGGNRLATPMTIAAGSDVTTASLTLLGPTTASARLTVASGAQAGRRTVTLTTPEGVSNGVSVSIIPITGIGLGRTISGTLSQSDLPSVVSSRAHADVYSFTPPVSRLATFFSPEQLAPFTITVRSTEFRSVVTFMDSAGSVLATMGDDGTGLAAATGLVFSPTTLYFEVTAASDGAGSYSVGFNAPIVASLTPSFGAQSSTVDVALTGQSLTSNVSIDAGPGITVSATAFVGPTGFSSRFTISPDATLGPRSVRVTTSTGTDILPFTVFPAIPSITVGQTISGALASSDQPSPTASGRYADLYALTVPASNSASVELKSTAFGPSLNVLTAQGEVLSHGDGNTVARISGLSPGTHLIEVTSVSPAIGDYTLSVPLPPTITSIVPDVGVRGTTFGVTLTGTNFSSPLTVTPFSTQIRVSNVRVYSPTMATAVFSLTGPTGSPVVNTGNVNVAADTGNSGTGVPFSILASGTSPTPASILRFPRLFSPAELGLTGVAVVNPSPQAAAVEFSMYSEAGTLMGYYTDTIGARSQLSRLGSELFAQAGGVGWIKITSATAGLQGFWVGGDFATVMDGAEGAVAAREILFPLVTSATELNIVNPTGGNNPMTLRLYDAGGSILASIPTSLASNGGFKNSAGNLFPGIDLSGARHIRVTGEAEVTGTSIVPNLTVTPSWVVLNGIDTSTASTEMNFAHVPTGGGWSSIAGVTNLSASSQTITVTFTPNTGSPVSVTRSLAAGASIRESVDSLFGFSNAYRDGWVKVVGTLPLSGFISYGFGETSGAAAVPAQAVPQSSMIFSHVATGPAWGTGLALLNATSTNANVEVYVMRKTGALVGGAANVPTAAFTLPAGTKRAALLTELVPASTADDGFVFVRSTNGVPLYGFELFFSRDSKIISNVPFGVLAPGITFTPPAP